MNGLKNLMEEIVFTKIDDIWDQTDYCKCDKCKLDIAAYALNRLPAKYVNSLQGTVINRFEALSIQNDAEITAVVFQAIQKIGEKPHKVD